MTKKDYVKLANTVFWLIAKNRRSELYGDMAYLTAEKYASQYDNFNKKLFDKYISDKLYNHYIKILDEEEVEEIITRFEEVTAFQV